MNKASKAAPDVLQPSVLKYAAFWRRAIAFGVVDAALLGSMVTLTRALLDTVADIASSKLVIGNLFTGPLQDPIYFLSLLIVPWLYYSIMHSSQWQATVGKRLFGLRVVDAKGKRINFGVASLRYLATIFSLASLLIGFVMALLHPRSRTLHDIVADTYVIEKVALTKKERLQPYHYETPQRS